nr:hypothetical protein [Butyrivibrio sp.]
MKNYTEENRIRPDILTAGVYWAIIIIMIYNIIAYRFYGDKGAFFAAGPLWLYGIFYSIFVLGVQKSVYIMVRLRARRSQYLNAETNMERSLRLFGAVGVILGIFLLALGFSFSKYLLGSSRGTFQCILVALSLFLLCSQGVLRGYLQGLNYTKPIIISDLLIAAVTVVFGTILSKALYDYGVKVNGLFHVDDFSAVYGSCGMLMGFFAGSLAGLIQIGVSFFLRKSEISDFVKTGAPRYLDNKNDV